jgi:5-formyltetrahydrofolate cyclo-ligase
MSLFLTVGLAFNEQIVENIPLEPHDKVLDYVLTSNDNNERESEFFPRHRSKSK